MRRLALVITLACVLSGLARAGEIHPTGAVATPTPTPSTATVSGEMPPTGATAPQGSSTLATIVLTLTNIVF